MDERLLNKLSQISEEERKILEGKKDIDRDLYYSSDSSIIDSDIVLANGKIIDIRPHTRFIHFPKHSHNYVEFIYMVQGESTHFIDDEKIHLKKGDLLFLNQNAIQEILPTGKDDIAVNFIILPQFFNEIFEIFKEEDNALRSFIIGCLTENKAQSNYLYYDTQDNIPIQNLLENLIWNLLEDEPNKRSINQLTMGLLFINLINHSDKIRVSHNSYEQNIALKALSYIDTHYMDARLSDFASENKTDIYTLSRIIKKQTGSTFKQLLENKRLNQACFLLTHTPLTIDEIAVNIGYENISFFYKLFKRTYDMSPKDYRKNSLK